MRELNQINRQNKFMISFDVNSLFINISLGETIDIAVNLLLTKNPQIGMNKKQLKTLFEFATCKSHFMFNNESFDQVDGGLPLGTCFGEYFYNQHVNMVI